MSSRLRWATGLLAGAAVLALVGVGVRIRLGRGAQQLAPGPQRGEPAPAYAAVSLTGDTVTLASLRGDVVLLNVWASWCDSCRAELPRLEELQRQYADSGLRVVGVSVDRDRDAARRFIREHGMTWLNLLDEDDHVMRTFNVGKGAPKTLVMDGSGRVQAFWYGALDSAKVRRILDVLVTASTLRQSGQLILARGRDPTSALDTVPEIDPRAIPPATRAAALRAARQTGWADPGCTRYFAWGSATYIRLVGGCPLAARPGAPDEHDRILAIGSNDEVSTADLVWYIEVCPGQRDTEGRPLPYGDTRCYVRKAAPTAAGGRP